MAEATLGEKVIPGLLDHHLAAAAWDRVIPNEPTDPEQKDDFWEPVPGDHGSHGPFDDRAHSSSPVFWITKTRFKVLGGLPAAGLGAA